MAKGLALPDSIEQILDLAANRLQQEQLCYQDALPLLYLHLCLFGSDGFQDIRQVVVDEAQDYSPLHFSILKKLFPNARYTIMGDYNQTIEKQETNQFYRDIADLFPNKRSCLITLSKGFRCSYEISEYSRRFLPADTQMESF